MRTLGAIIGSRETYTIKSGTLVMNAVLFMSEKNIGAVAVIDEQNKLIGLFSERDLMKRVVAVYKDPAKLSIDEVMTKTLMTAEPETPFNIALNKMKEMNIRHMPVVKERTLIGMISIRDLMELETQTKDEEIQYLNQYYGLNTV